MPWSDATVPALLDEAQPRTIGELVVQDGPSSGVRAAIAGPALLIGRAENVDLRLDVDGVEARHCVLWFQRGELSLCDLRSGTCLNGAPISMCPVRHGDVIQVGPIHLQVHLSDDVGGEQVEDALRIQAAAVAAQQFALLDQEVRLEQQKAAFDQQQHQLANHLESKRQRLTELRAETRTARDNLARERQAYERRVGEVTLGFAKTRRDLADEYKELRRERRNVQRLRWRLKDRHQRLLRAERAQLAHATRATNETRQQLQQESARLNQEKERFLAFRQRFQGDLEIQKRQLQDDWQQLRAAQSAWDDQEAKRVAMLRDCDGRMATREERSQQLATEIREQEEHCALLRDEAHGLESRVRGLRRRLADEARTELAVQQQPTRAEQFSLRHEEPLSLLEELGDDLADQQLALVEQSERLAIARAGWQGDCAILAVELEELALDHQQRERTLEREEAELRERTAEAASQRRLLEGWRSCLSLEMIAWEAERERLQLDCGQRREELERGLAEILETKRQWEAEQTQQRQQLAAERAACETLRQEWAGLRGTWLQRSARLDQLQRTLAAQALALEQQKQECVRQAASPRRAEKQLQRLQKRWQAQNAATARELEKQQAALAAEAARLHALQTDVKKQADNVARREALVSRRQSEWEEQQLLAILEQRQLREEVQSVLIQRQTHETQVAELRDEVDRLARLLLDEPPAACAIVQAA